MPTLDVAINALKAKHGAKAFNDAAKKVQRGSKDIDKGLTRTQKGLDKVGGKFRSLAKAAVGMAAVYGVGRFMKSSVREMADYEMELANIATMLDKTTMHFMPKYKTELSKLAIKYGEATGSLSKGLYDILSASIDAADALDVLEVSAIAAKAGLTDTGKAADILTTIINAYGFAASDAARIGDILFATVKRGKTTFDELASSMGMVVSLSATAGLSIEEVTAALATMTRAGISTDMAMTSLRGILTTFLSPTRQNIDAAKKLGLELNTNTLRTIGLTGAVGQLEGATAEQIAAVFSNVRALSGLAALLQSTEGYMIDLAEVTDSTGKQLEAFGKVSDTTSMKLSQLSESWKFLKRAIGDEAKPAIDNMADAMIVIGPKIGSLITLIGSELPDAITEMYFTAILGRKKLLSAFAKIDLLGILDDKALKREIKSLEIIIEGIQGITALQVELDKVSKNVADSFERMAAAAKDVTPHFEDWGDARDFLLELSGSVATTRDAIMGVVPPTKEFTKVVTELREEIESIQLEIQDFGKSDIEKQISQFERFESILSSPSEILKYRDSIKGLEVELTKLGELEKAEAIKKSKRKAGLEVTTAFNEIANERKLLGLTNEERERAIKLTQLEAQAKVLLGDRAGELTDMYMKELKGLQKAREIQEVANQIREGVGDLIRAPLTALMDETRDMGDVLNDVLRDIGMSILKTLYEETITKPLQDVLMKSISGMMEPLTDALANLLSGIAGGIMKGIGGIIGSLIPGLVVGGAGAGAASGAAESAFTSPWAKGGAFKDGELTAFGKGGVVNKPTIFPMANGMGLMGEKEPEAVMPLTRDSRGRLGVRAETSQAAPLSIKIINVLDVSAFEDYLSTGDGERAVVNIMRRNKQETQEVTL